MPPWFETTLAIFAGIAAVFFFAKYRETATALEESERMKHKLSKELDRYRDVTQLRALRDSLTGERSLPVDDEGREHLLIRDSARKLVHISLTKSATPLAEGETARYRAGGAEQNLPELD